MLLWAINHLLFFVVCGDNVDKWENVTKDLITTLAAISSFGMFRDVLQELPKCFMIHCILEVDVFWLLTVLRVIVGLI